MKRSLKTRVLLTLSVFCLVLSSFTTAFAVDMPNRVLLESPAKDAAVVDGLEGFGTYPHKGKLATNTTTEGLVIRESYIKDGKIYIPPSGLYYTARFGNLHTNPLADNAISLLGQKYNWVDYRYYQDILSDASFMKVGDRVPFGDGSKALELTGFSATSPGFTAPQATFSILKPSGNYYGSTFSVSTSLREVGELLGGTGKTTGSYGLAGQDESWIQDGYYYSSVASVGASYLVSDKVSTNGIVVKEFGTGSVDYFMLSKTEPEKMVLAVNDRVELNNWHMRVLNVTSNSATVRLWNSLTNETLTKELGPFTAETIDRIPADQTQRHKFVIRPESNDVQVSLDIYSNPFGEANKVKLTVFKDIIKINNPDTWPTDDRFIFRPDT